MHYDLGIIMMHGLLYIVLGCWVGFIAGLFWSGIMRTDRLLQMSSKTADLQEEAVANHGWSTRVN